MSSAPDDSSLSSPAVHLGSISPELKQELAALYHDLSIEQQSLSARCHQCGKCCQFIAYDHQLWVTSLELAYLFETEGARPVSQPGVCPYLVDNQCTARIGRALGCRIFLCEQPPVEMEALHEKYFQRLQDLARRHHFEVEYREFLETIGDIFKP